MTFTLTYAWWWIPAAVTLLSVGWAIWFGWSEDSGWFAGISYFFTLMPAFFVSAVAWAIGGFCK